MTVPAEFAINLSVKFLNFFRCLREPFDRLRVTPQAPAIPKGIRWTRGLRQAQGALSASLEH